MKRILTLFMLCCILLTGCWDKRMLKEHSLILAIGYDLNEDDTISKTVTFPQEKANNISQGEDQPEGLSKILTTTGNTVSDSDIKLEQIISQKFDRSKARILLIGKNLAETGIFPTLDSMYRDPRGPLSASVAIVSKTAESGLMIKETQGFLNSEFYFDLLKSAEESGVIKRENIQSVCPVILSGKKDIVLPYIKVDEESNGVKIEGLALFSGDKMTGTLNNDQSIMLLILLDEITKKVKLNLQISDDKERREENFVTFAIRKEKRKFKVVKNNEKVNANIQIDLRIEITEYPTDHLYEERQIEQLGKKISQQLTLLANETIASIQEANSDSLGIGERVKVIDYTYWEKNDWREVYPNVPINVEFNIDIVQHGIIS